MEWIIPIQTFKTENVQLETLTTGPKPIIPLSYSDDGLLFPSLVFLLPTLKLKSYDSATGRLVLSLADSPQTLNKLLMLQDLLLSAVFTNQMSWFKLPYAKTRMELRTGFQSMIHENDMILYYPNQYNHMDIQGAANSSKWMSTAGLVPGMKLRVVVKLHGISFHVHPALGTWTGKFRLQHRIISGIMKMQD